MDGRNLRAMDGNMTGPGEHGKIYLPRKYSTFDDTQNENVHIDI